MSARDDQILTGATINGITFPAIDGQLNLTPVDINILHIGTNDIHRDASANNGTDPLGTQEVEMILNAIDIWEAANNPITVFLARIIERSTNPGVTFPNPDIQTFNDNIVALAQSRPSDDIVFVDQQNALTYPDDKNSGDVVHPNQTGYDKMADTWLAALENSGDLPVCSP